VHRTQISMKAIFLVSLLGFVSAAIQRAPFNTQYVKNNGGVCQPATGYQLFCLAANPTANMPATASSATTPCAAVTTAPDLTMPCTTFFDDTTTGTYVIGCAANYTVTGLAAGNSQLLGRPVVAPPGAVNTWQTTAQNIAGFQGYVDFAPAVTPVLTCVPVVTPVCNYTCTGSTGGCKAASGNIAVGATAQSVCNTGFASVSTVATCPVNGSSSFVIVCSNDPLVVPANSWFLIANLFPHSVPRSCNCNKDPVCVKRNAFSPICSKCYLTPCNGGGSGQRQNVFASAAYCPAGTVTVAQMNDCFRQGACDGAIGAGSLCVYGPVGAGTATCPTCPDGSKKGLLGLLGLLGLIPLLLCSSLLCLLIFCIRRNKKERDVHFATFDAGAPQVVAPVCAEFPVAHQTQTVHHATYVGPQHCAVPSGFGY
jgi:hypothetical protein